MQIINAKIEFLMMSIGVGLFPANTLISLQRLQSLAFGFGTFAYAKDRASSPHDGLLRESPTPMLLYNVTGYSIFSVNSHTQNQKQLKKICVIASPQGVAIPMKRNKDVTKHEK
jgi:hypothetical protein